MANILVENIKSEFRNSVHKVKCARNYVLKAGHSPFVMERIPALKNIKPADAKILGIRLWRRKKDRFGRWIQNFASFEQPEVSAAYARETIYDKTNPICAKCRRCLIK